MSDLLEQYYIVNLKYAVQALREIRDLDRGIGLLRKAQNIADQALKDMSVNLLDKVGAELEKDQQELEGK
ncbi:unnamed protein product [marine sediment metagenome]|uniref:Uncharacterized protein n=1 Tax=marine sediment metagenome TaxID=412755 RepID=X0VQ32_9ZZZZ